MKNRILYWVICLLVFTSCSDFLEDYSQDGLCRFDLGFGGIIDRELLYQKDRKKNIVINSGKRETYFPVVTCNG